MAKDLRIVGPLLAAALIVARGEAAQTQAPEASASTVVFQPLIADPKEPQFFAAYLWERSARLGSRLGSVGFGQTFGVAGGRDWEVSVAAAVFSQFDLARATADLMNTDYRVGVPVTYRRAAVTVRFQLYHQSSHLGDEYMAHTNSQRVDLSFEAAELLVARDMAHWRLYGGGEYTFMHSPADLKPGVLHGGLEYRPSGVLLRVGRLAEGRLVAAVDAKSFEDRRWEVGWSAVTGLELGDPSARPESGWRWSVLLKAYTGPAPYGEFFRDRVSSLGFGIGLAL